MSAQNTDPFVNWFRQSSPYINAHRRRTFVVYVGGEAIIEEDCIRGIVHDIALLNSLGVRLVLVHGARPQIESSLKAHSIDAPLHKGIRATSVEAMNVVQSTVGRIRSQLEARFSTGLANSPMAGARIRILGGNLVMAKPLGVRDGVDYGHSGEVRRIDKDAINSILDLGAVVLISPVGYSLTGEAFNIGAEDVATDVSILLKADKLILFTDEANICDDDGEAVRQLSTTQAETCAQQSGKDNLHLLSGLRAAKNGVRRVHLVDYQTDGALLRELFTRDGIGTLITTDNYDTLRQANIDDVGGILELIRPLEEEGILVRRSRELLETEVNHFTVLERDGMIIGCAALYPYPEESAVEMACLAVHKDYQNGGRGDTLLHTMEKQARTQGFQRLFVLSSRSGHWFLERGYEENSVDVLPLKKQQLYNYQRKSKVFIKPLAQD
ncbi:MAG: amino-acid N-acetyltransferase [Gammaproteobacteria bacterium]|nr:amino-acid N-acetyltransferase [Gammaproteobacteria bacterium]